jgi:glycosyltransferase involved in cell wall biosynthesis
LVALLKREKPAIVHTHTSKGGGVGRIAAYFAKVPITIHTIHGFPFHEGSSHIKRRIYVMLERAFSKVTDLLLSQSIEDVETAGKLGIVSRNGLPVYIGNGVDTNRFMRSVYKGMYKKVRADLGISDKAVAIITIGRLTKEKGYYELLEALNTLKNRNWVALLVGPDDGIELDLKSKVSQYGLNDQVLFLGKRDDVAELLNASDIFVLASYREGVPRSVIEAQAMGLPAIVTDIRGCREVVVDRETGIIIRPQRADLLAEAIGCLLDDEHLRVEMGHAGSLKINKEFSETMVFERILRAYQSVITRKLGTTTR